MASGPTRWASPTGRPRPGSSTWPRTLAVEWGPKIRVLTVTVGLIVTEEAHLYYGDEAGMQAVADTIPLRRMGTPEDIADAVLMLCSPLARWMTATNVHVDGGGEIPSYLECVDGRRHPSRPLTSDGDPVRLRHRRRIRAL